MTFFNSVVFPTHRGQCFSVHDDVLQISLNLSKIEQARTQHAPLNRKDVTIIPVFGQLPTPQVGDGGSDISINEQVHEKAIGFRYPSVVTKGS
jgi:hypothetical protein